MNFTHNSTGAPEDMSRPIVWPAGPEALTLRRAPVDGPAGAAARCFQTASRTTDTTAIATVAANVSGALRRVSTAKNTSTMAVTAIAARTTGARAPMSARRR
jgi:hypothetical protein